MSFKVKDHYFKKAKQEKFLARSIYKLQEIDQKYKLFRAGQCVLDLGYYPGSWTQYLSKALGEKGSVISVDIQPINTKITGLNNVKLFEKDAFEIHDPQELNLSEKCHSVLSDMAPKTTGVKSVDQMRSLELVEKVFGILDIFLRPGGHTVVKVFESHDAQLFLKSQKKRFKEFHYLKPKSTRSVSKEFFAIGKGFQK